MREGRESTLPPGGVQGRRRWKTQVHRHIAERNCRTKLPRTGVRAAPYYLLAAAMRS